MPILVAKPQQASVKNSGKVFRGKFVQDLGEVILPLMDTYATLDNKDKSTHDPPTHHDVLDALEVVNVNPEVEELTVTAFNAAGPVLMTSIQMLAVNALLHNVTNFAHEAVRTPATEDFKANPNKDTMMNYLFKSILMKRRAVERRTSLYDRCRLCQNQAAVPTPARDGQHHCPARKRTRVNQPLDQAALDLASVSARRSLGGKIASDKTLPSRTTTMTMKRTTSPPHYFDEEHPPPYPLSAAGGRNGNDPP